MGTTDPWLPAPQPKPVPDPIPTPPWPDPPTSESLRRSLVSPLTTDFTAGHRLIHPRAQAGCALCPQEGLSCRWCGLPLPECLDVAGHDRSHRGSESTWRGAA